MNVLIDMAMGQSDWSLITGCAKQRVIGVWEEDAEARSSARCFEKFGMGFVVYFSAILAGHLCRDCRCVAMSTLTDSTDRTMEVMVQKNVRTLDQVVGTGESGDSEDEVLKEMHGDR